MTELQLLGALAVGIVLGVIFFWALWVTTRGIEHAKWPALRLAVSLPLRFGVVLGGLYFLLQHGGCSRAVVGMVGFTLVRLVAVRRVRVPLARVGSRP